jgi:uncharacterized membrane protein
MQWLIMAPPILWAVVGHLDKYLLSRQGRGGVGALTLVAALTGVPTAAVILLARPDALHLRLALVLPLVLSGMVHVGSLALYLSALSRADAAVVAAVIQTVAVFSYLLGWVVLGETLTLRQLVASVLIIGGGAVLTVEFDRASRAIRFQWVPFCLALLASLLVALSGLTFKFVALQSGRATPTVFWQTSFWEYVGFAGLAAILLVAARGWRRQLVAMIRANARSILGLNVLTEAINLAGEIAMRYATLLVPLALAWTADGLQPALTLLYGVLLAMWRPRASVQRLVKHALAQQTAMIMVILLGAVLLNPFQEPH